MTAPMMEDPYLLFTDLYQITDARSAGSPDFGSACNTMLRSDIVRQCIAADDDATHDPYLVVETSFNDCIRVCDINVSIASQWPCQPVQNGHAAGGISASVPRNSERTPSEVASVFVDPYQDGGQVLDETKVEPHEATKKLVCSSSRKAKVRTRVRRKPLGFLSCNGAADSSVPPDPHGAQSKLIDHSTDLGPFGTSSSSSAAQPCIPNVPSDGILAVIHSPKDEPRPRPTKAPGRMAARPPPAPPMPEVSEVICLESDDDIATDADPPISELRGAYVDIDHAQFAEVQKAPDPVETVDSEISVSANHVVSGDGIVTKDLSGDSGDACIGQVEEVAAQQMQAVSCASDLEEPSPITPPSDTGRMCFTNSSDDEDAVATSSAKDHSVEHGHEQFGLSTTPDPIAAAEAEALAAKLESALGADVAVARQALEDSCPMLAQYLRGHPQGLLTKAGMRRGGGKSGKGKSRFFSEAFSEDVMSDKVVTGCWACGKLDHESHNCVFKRCFICSRLGHEHFECTENWQWCSGCGRQGHPPSKCPDIPYHAGMLSSARANCRWLFCKAKDHVLCKQLPSINGSSLKEAPHRRTTVMASQLRDVSLKSQQGVDLEDRHDGQDGDNVGLDCTGLGDHPESEAQVKTKRRGGRKLKRKR